MANLSNINNILRISSSGVGLNKDNTGPSELDIESAGADMIDMTRTGQKTYRFAISGASAFSLFDVAANADRLVINSAGNSTFTGSISSGDITIAVDDTPTINFKKASSADVLGIINVTTDAGTGGKMAFQTKRNGNTPIDALVIDDDQNVGIGNTSPSSSTSNANKLVIGDGSASTGITILTPSNTSGNLYFADGTTGNEGYRGIIRYNHNNDKFQFYTSATERITIIANGNVGIGTNSPDAQLEISNPNATSGAGGATLRLTRADVTSVAGDPVGTIEFYSTDADGPKTTAYIKSMSEELYGREGSLAFGVSQSINANATEAMRIDSNGQVGIGTATPNTKLEISGNNTSRNTLLNLLTLNGGASASNPYDGFGVGIKFNGRDYSNAVRDYAYIYGVIEDQSSSSTPAGDPGFESQLRFYTNTGGASAALPTQKMVITAAGNVGIGTASPGAKLDVVGDVRTSTRYLIATGTANETAAIGYWDGVNFRVESGAAKPMLITSYQGNIKLGISGGTTMTIQSSNVGIETTSPGAKLDVNQGSEDFVQRNYGPGNNQGFPQKITITKWYPVTSLGTKLLIPVISQGNLNNTTIVRMWGHSAVFNRASGYTNRSFTLDFTFGSLQLIYGLTTLNSTGNVSSVTQTSTTGGANGEIQVNFTNNYIQSQTGASYGGVYITLEYMTGSTNKSIIASGIALN